MWECFKCHRSWFSQYCLTPTPPSSVFALTHTHTHWCDLNPGWSVMPTEWKGPELYFDLWPVHGVEDNNDDEKKRKKTTCFDVRRCGTLYSTLGSVNVELNKIKQTSLSSWHDGLMRSFSFRGGGWRTETCWTSPWEVWSKDTFFVSLSWHYRYT